ncbi:MAG: phospholipase D family protein [Pseudomonadota bacterium]
MTLRASLGVLVLAASLLSGCAALPALEGRVASSALADTGATRIGKAVVPLAAAHPGLSGVHVLLEGRDAFAARMMMADAAERSLDVQYYIWRNDSTGMLLMNALRAAAARGVRVRLLLDDNNTAGLDGALALLAKQPNVQVRLFNPFAARGARLLGMLGDFKRLNRRMHNKSFTVDGQATIVGGRNVGDEYFDAAGDVLFSDLDIMAVGAVVGEVERDFDRYWNSRSAYPLLSLVGAPAAPAAAELQEQADTLTRAPAALAYLEAIRTSPFVAQLTQQVLPLEWAPVRLVSDDPDKVLGLASPESDLAMRLPALLGAPTRQVDLVSPYFVPGPVWNARLGILAGSGVKVRVLTNSLEATDVIAVHAGYAKWRVPLLRAGVTLMELKRSWPREKDPKRKGMPGSSASSLHAKTFAVDLERVFVGSFNLDPRSASLNTEMGFVIDSKVLAQRMSDVLDTRVPERSYEVRLSPEDKLYWVERGPNGSVRHDTEPGAGVWQRAVVEFMSLLPIDWML